MLDKTTFTPHGKHLIAGEWVSGKTTFRSEPARGEPHGFSVGTPELVDRAAKAAEEAFWTYGYSTRDERAAFLEAIADEIEARADAITAIGSAETGLPEARIQGERARTVGQLRLFASHIRKGEYLDRRYDEAMPVREPLPRPDLRMIHRPIGPVAVFGASNGRRNRPQHAKTSDLQTVHIGHLPLNKRIEISMTANWSEYEQRAKKLLKNPKVESLVRNVRRDPHSFAIIVGVPKRPCIQSIKPAATTSSAVRCV